MITAENYFSKENNFKHWGSTQYKTTAECESQGYALCNGLYEIEKTKSMMIGSYIDAHFEGTLAIFTANLDKMYIEGTKRKIFTAADYILCDKIINRLERDELFMKYMSGEPQKIMTGEIEGIEFKVKFDSYHPGKAIVDLKIMKDMQSMWKNGVKLNFIEAWGYDVQGAIYQEVEYKNSGIKLPFFIAVGTKEKETDLTVIQIPQERLDYCLDLVKSDIVSFNDIKLGKIEPNRCEVCNWCKSTKVLKTPIDYKMLDGGD
jgi:hypothetical protein